jgi:Methyltransferase domain
MKCPLCYAEANLSFTHLVREKYDAGYALCPRCDLLFVVDPTWLNEAYARPINTTDTGYVMRNIYLSRKTLILFFLIYGLGKLRKSNFLDYAAGYGMLTRIMRDYGLNFLSDDPFTKNLFAQGFEYSNEKISGATCFECFEHFTSPLKEAMKIRSISDTVFFSTRLRPIGEIPASDWEYYGFNHGQHTAFYSKKTLAYIANACSMNLYTDGNDLHLITTKKMRPSIMKEVNFLTKMQFDIFLKKRLSSKTTSDQKDLITKGL